MGRYILTASLLLLIAAAVSPLLSGAHETPRPVPPTLAVATPAQPSPLVTYRGREGFWRVGQDARGVWWFVAPDGRREFLNTVTTVQPFQPSRDPTGPHYVSRAWTGPDNLPKDTGPDPAALRAWAGVTLDRIRTTGFKGLGAWCNPVFHDFDVPITRDLNLWAWVHGDRRLYNPHWRETVELAVRTQVVPLKDNRNLVGYYTDNELNWSDGEAPGAYFDNTPADNPNRREVTKVIRELWPTVEALNADWGTSLASLDEIDAWQMLPTTPSSAKLHDAWLEHVARDYFTITTDLIRRYDPNHLVMGVRYNGWAPPPVVAASRGITDAQSLNQYVGDARLDEEQFRMIYERSGQPLVITEYSFHALDGRSGNRNTFGFAAQVLDQQARADGYRQMTTGLARVPWVIGADWFQWADEPPGGRAADGEDVNFGVVDVDDRPYQLLADAIRETTPQLNVRHAASAADDAHGVWRESFAFDRKPTFSAPYLSSAPKLNGELSDWPAAARLDGVRRSQTVGLDRSTLPVPLVYLGWRDEGVYLAFQVSDRDITGAPATGWWWTRDNAEFWISTRPVSAGQDRYDPYCHQFYFVPVSFPDKDGVAGVVGRWHRGGDALKDNLVPAPYVRSATRVLPDRYVTEIFIPAEALNGFDPRHQPQIAFNFHAKDYQHAIDYFWSAPKEVQTQLRPKTWGTVTLDPRPVELTNAD